MTTYNAAATNYAVHKSKVYNSRWYRFQRRTDGAWLAADGFSIVPKESYRTASLYLGDAAQVKAMVAKNPELGDRKIWKPVNVTKEIRAQYTQDALVKRG